MCFGGSPSPPRIPTPPPPPEKADYSRAAQGKEKSRVAARKGRQSTVLTGPRGSQEQANIRRKTLLGEQLPAADETTLLGG